jgi:single-stranded-DNA-specific exonuclease
MDNLEWKPSKAPDFQEVGRLSKDTGLNPLVASLLIQRGMNSTEEVEDFLDPSREKLHDPFLMKDMDKAVSRIMKAIERNERIMVYGDYDVDGTTSVAMVSSFLKGLQVPVLPYIPMRYGEGYGVSPKGVERAKVSGCTLIITLDCGTKDFDALAAAAEAGIDTIVCDHHLPADTLPTTHALLNPKREDCAYPFKELSGAGVAFKLLTGLVNTIGLTMSSVYDHLDLLALSIGADLVEITGENRILAHHGMRKLRKTMRPGIRAMLHVANIDRVPNSVRDISFTLGPRINAAGRVGHALKAVELLMASDDNTAYELAYELESMNQARRDLDEDMTEEALAQMAEQPAGRCCTVVCGEGWHRGVLGIVASRLVEARYRPTIVLSEENGLLMGSARSVRGVDIHEALEDCRSYLEQFGGHPMAAGLQLRSDQLKDFTAAIEKSIASQVNGCIPEPSISYHLEIDLNAMTPQVFEEMGRLAPFGPGNGVPVFMASGLKAALPPRTVGHRGRHLKLILQTTEVPHGRFEAIGFGMGDRLEEVRQMKEMDLVFTLVQNTFRGRTSLNMHLRAIRPSES